MFVISLPEASALLAPFAALAFVRLSRESLLANANRARIHAEVGEHPGLATTEVAERTGISESVVRHHLGVLSRHGLVRSSLSGSHRAWCLAGSSTPPPHEVLRSASRLAILAALEGAPAPTQKQLVERTGFSQRLVSYHIKRLEEWGLVTGSGERPQAYRPTEALRALLSEASLPPKT